MNERNERLDTYYTLQDLHLRAADLVGRPVDVQKTTFGKFIVLWMSLSHSPPPRGDSEEEALRLFIEWYEKTIAPKLGDLPSVDATPPIKE